MLAIIAAISDYPVCSDFPVLTRPLLPCRVVSDRIAPAKRVLSQFSVWRTSMRGLHSYRPLALAASALVVAVTLTVADAQNFSVPDG